ncbi:MAG: hypothetical protein ACREBG_17825 [Pyrinomonadaceae bacterium]
MRKQHEEHSAEKLTWRQLVERLAQLSPRWRLVLGSTLLLLLLVLLYPFKTVIVPEWNVRVVDDGGAPVRQIRVTEHWQDYLLEAAGHEDARTTNEDGRVGFPPRSIRAGLVSRLLARISKLTKAGNQSRTDPYAAIVIWGSKDHQTTVSVHTGEGLPPAQIVAQRVR